MCVQVKGGGVVVLHCCRWCDALGGVSSRSAGSFCLAVVIAVVQAVNDKRDAG